LRRLAASAAVALLCATQPATGQISLNTAVDLALRNSPRVKSSEAEVARARAILSQAKDIYIPSVNAGAALGQAYGYSNYPPTLFTVTSQSLIYNASQLSYVGSAGAGVDAAQQSLQDIRETVAEDAALTFVALDHDQQREEVLRQEADLTAKLLSIVQARFDAGQDSQMDLTQAKLSVARLHLLSLRAQNDTANDRNHLARLLGVPPGSLRAEGGFPDTRIAADNTASTGGYANASVAAAFATARAKQLQARGDSRFLYRPQVSLAIQYNRYATFTNAWSLIQKENNNQVGADEEVFGVQITIPLLDRLRTSKAVESAAEAAKALHDAEFAQVNVLDAQSRLNNSIEVLGAQADVAALEQQLAQEQLDIVRAQLSSPNSTPVPLTPKDEQNALIGEREKYLTVVDTAFQLHQAEVSLLRQSGHLQDWLLHAGVSTAPTTTSTPPPHP
jgi:outer membrane protein TolC